MKPKRSSLHLPLLHMLTLTALLAAALLLSVASPVTAFSPASLLHLVTGNPSGDTPAASDPSGDSPTRTAFRYLRQTLNPGNPHQPLKPAADPIKVADQVAGIGFRASTEAVQGFSGPAAKPSSAVPSMNPPIFPEDLEDHNSDTPNPIIPGPAAAAADATTATAAAATADTVDVAAAVVADMVLGKVEEGVMGGDPGVLLDILEHLGDGVTGEFGLPEMMMMSELVPAAADGDAEGNDEKTKTLLNLYSAGAKLSDQASELLQGYIAAAELLSLKQAAASAPQLTRKPYPTSRTEVDEVYDSLSAEEGEVLVDQGFAWDEYALSAIEEEYYYGNGVSDAEAFTSSYMAEYEAAVAADAEYRAAAVLPRAKPAAAAAIAAAAVSTTAPSSEEAYPAVSKRHRKLSQLTPGTPPASPPAPVPVPTPTPSPSPLPASPAPPVKPPASPPATPPVASPSPAVPVSPSPITPPPATSPPVTSPPVTSPPVTPNTTTDVPPTGGNTTVGNSTVPPTLPPAPPANGVVLPNGTNATTLDVNATANAKLNATAEEQQEVIARLAQEVVENQAANRAQPVRVQMDLIGIKSSQYSQWAPSILRALGSLANVLDRWELQAISEVTYDSATGSPMGRKLRADPTSSTAETAPGRLLLQRRRPPPPPPLAGQTTGQTAGSASATAQTATRMTATRLVYQMNTTAYSLVAWRVTQPVMTGVSSFGCGSQLCEQLSALGVPVVPTSLVVEPDGYDVFRAAQAQAQAEKAAAAAAAAEAANAANARRNSIIIGVVVAVGGVIGLLLLYKCLLKRVFTQTRQLLQARKAARKEAREAGEAAKGIEVTAATLGSQSKSLSFKELSEQMGELPTFVRVPIGRFTPEQGYLRQGSAAASPGRKVMGSSTGSTMRYSSDGSGSATSGTSWGSHPAATTATAAGEVFYSESLPSRTVSTSSYSRSPGSDASYDNEQQPAGGSAFAHLTGYSPRLRSSFEHTPATSHLLRSPGHGPLRRAFGTASPIQELDTVNFAPQGGEVHTGSTFVTRFPSTGGSPSAASAPAALATAAMGQYPSNSRTADKSRSYSHTQGYNLSPTELLLQSPPGINSHVRRHPTPGRPVTRVTLSDPRTMMVSPFAQVQQAMETPALPRLVAVTDSGDDDVAAGRSDDSRQRSHHHHHQQQPSLQHSFAPFGLNAQPLRIGGPIGNKQYITSSSTLGNAPGGAAVAPRYDGMQMLGGDVPMSRSSSRSKERRSAYWAVFGEKVEEARKGPADKDGAGWDQC